MSEVTKDLGQHDVSFGTLIVGTETTQEQADALVEQYAQMFAHGARTPVLKRPSLIGLDYEGRSSHHSTASRWKPGSSRRTPTGC